MELTSAEKMRDADSRAIHVSGIPSTLLMTNAAAHITKAALELIGESKRAAILCGSGNNGGDGIAAAMQLLRRGIDIRCFLVGRRDKMTDDTAEMERRLVELGGKVESFDPESESQKKAVARAGVIIDAMFGIGLNSELRGNSLSAVHLINASPAPVVSVDIASGVEADTGRILGEAVKADVTVTFSMAKVGHFAEPGCTMCGELWVCDIGIPSELLENATIGVTAVCDGDLCLPKRERISHKGDYGRLLIIGGSVGYTGAPSLCALAACRSGAGLVSLGVPQSIYAITAGRLWEPMPFPLSDDENGRISLEALPAVLDRLSNSDVCILGCGLSRTPELEKLTRAIICTGSKPMVIDADGLYALGNNPDTIKNAAAPLIITPHEGEFVRLGGVLTGDRVADALGFAKSRNCVVVLKGHRTVCAFPEGEACIISAGNPGMAKGGSGDVLAGIIGALLCQMPVKQAVVTACFIHAHAGDLCAKRLSEYAMLATDVVDEIPNVMLKMECEK